MKSIRRHPNRHLGKWTTPILQAQRDGFQALSTELERKYANHPVQDDMKYTRGFITCIGDAITAQLSNEVLNGYFPECWFAVRHGLPLGNTFTIQFSVMQQSKTPVGTAFFGRKRPRITLDGRRYTIAFSRHAMERICERVCDLQPYLSRAVVSGYLNGAATYKPFKLPSGDQAIAIGSEVYYHPCGPDDAHRKLFPPNELLIGRIGYAPIVLFNNLAIAKTFLPCGMRNTPEARILQQSNLPTEVRNDYQEKAIAFAKRGWIHQHELQVFKWFAEQGHPLIGPDHDTQLQQNGKPSATLRQFTPRRSDRGGLAPTPTTVKDTVEPHPINQFAAQDNLLEPATKNPPIC